VLAVAAPGCDFVRKFQGGDEPAAPTPTTTSPARQARLTVAIVPNPVLALRNPRAPALRSARWTVQISESGGVGGTLSFVNVTLRDAATGVPVDPSPFLSLDAGEIARQAGTNRLAAGGTLVLAQGIDFESPGAMAQLTIAAQLLDDEGNLVGQQATALVQ
jgi:hypothetical protein